MDNLRLDLSVNLIPLEEEAIKRISNRNKRVTNGPKSPLYKSQSAEKITKHDRSSNKRISQKNEIKQLRSSLSPKFIGCSEILPTSRRSLQRCYTESCTLSNFKSSSPLSSTNTQVLGISDSVLEPNNLNFDCNNTISSLVIASDNSFKSAGQTSLGNNAKTILKKKKSFSQPNYYKNISIEKCKEVQQKQHCDENDVSLNCIDYENIIPFSKTRKKISLKKVLVKVKRCKMIYKKIKKNQGKTTKVLKKLTDSRKEKFKIKSNLDLNFENSNNNLNEIRPITNENNDHNCEFKEKNSTSNLMMESDEEDSIPLQLLLPLRNDSKVNLIRTDKYENNHELINVAEQGIEKLPSADLDNNFIKIFDANEFKKSELSYLEKNQITNVSEKLLNRISPLVHKQNLRNSQNEITNLSYLNNQNLSLLNKESRNLKKKNIEFSTITLNNIKESSVKEIKRQATTTDLEPIESTNKLTTPEDCKRNLRLSPTTKELNKIAKLPSDNLKKKKFKSVKKTVEQNLNLMAKINSKTALASLEKGKSLEISWNASDNADNLDKKIDPEVEFIKKKKEAEAECFSLLENSFEKSPSGEQSSRTVDIFSNTLALDIKQVEGNKFLHKIPISISEKKQALEVKQHFNNQTKQLSNEANISVFDDSNLRSSDESKMLDASIIGNQIDTNCPSIIQSDHGINFFENKNSLLNVSEVCDKAEVFIDNEIKNEKVESKGSFTFNKTNCDQFNKNNSNEEKNFDASSLLMTDKEIIDFPRSPSSNSDSAKGSSIHDEFDQKLNEIDLMKSSTLNANDFIIGNIFWGRVSKYPFWPCIVWPDPNGKITANNRNVERVHVKFFADNGRRSWINRNNIIPYNGRREFEDKVEELTKMCGKKFSKIYSVSNSFKKTWIRASEEAEILLKYPGEERCAKFQEVLKESMDWIKTNRNSKRISMSSRNSVCSSDSLDIYVDSNANEYNKRTRSPTPESPAFENNSKKISSDFKQFVKRQRIDLSLSRNQNLFTSFQDLYKFLRENLNPSNEDAFRFHLEAVWKLSKPKIISSVRTSNRVQDMVENNFRKSLELSTKAHRKSLDFEVRGTKREKLEINISVPLEQVIQDIVELPKNYLFHKLKKGFCCKICLKLTDEPTFKCLAPNCNTWMHVYCAQDAKTNSNGNITENQKTFPSTSQGNKSFKKFNDEFSTTTTEMNVNQKDGIICTACKLNLPPACFICNSSTIDDCIQTNLKIDSSQVGQLIKCQHNQCGRYFHQKCLKQWPQAITKKLNDKIEILCPSHTCQTCISDNPKRIFLQVSKPVKCVKCPAAYHMDSKCIPAGSFLLTTNEMICHRHRNMKVICNTDWCFICSKGGSLICCEMCPASFHLECLNISDLPEDGYLCEECETGRLPLYGEMVWAKFRSCNWWPGIILPTPIVPLPLQRLGHDKFSFCVRFFGTHDHGWLSRNRVFLYNDDDWKFVDRKESNKLYSTAIEECRLVSDLLKSKKIELNVNDDKQIHVAPQPYKKILVNRAVPPVSISEITDLSEFNPCNCHSKMAHPCGPGSNCLNRLLFTECHPKLCPAKNKCENQMFEKRLYAPINLMPTSDKGFGLFSEMMINAGSFVIEYVGELINDVELKRRIAQKQEEKDENYYFLVLKEKIIIDAGQKGNLARFMNHSCEPNCYTQKWTVNGVPRVGLFALHDIPPKTELTFNYLCVGNEKTKCYCGAEKCVGYIGAKYKKPENNESEVQLKAENSNSKKLKSKISNLNKVARKTVMEKVRKS